MVLTKIFLPGITVVKLEGEGVEPSYFTMVPGETSFPSEDIIETEEDWRRALREAKQRGLQIEVHEV